MCKFNNRLFVFAFICLLGLLKVRVFAKPVQEPQIKYKSNDNDDLNELMAITALLAPQDNYDLHYDQRQKGEENYRLKLDGFFIGLPQEESSALLLLSDDIFENIGEFGITNGRNKLAPSSNSADHLSSSLDSNQDLIAHASQNDSFKNPDTAVVEIPAPKKSIDARHYVDLEDSEKYPKKSDSRTRSYISHLVNLFKRGRKN